jgi:hypothetical protein
MQAHGCPRLNLPDLLFSVDKDEIPYATFSLHEKLYFMFLILKGFHLCITDVLIGIWFGKPL